jgi:adenylyltransferase/sulfurtransferase
MTVRELSELQARGEGPFLLDVRQPEEYAAANIGGELIPLGDLPSRLDELADRRDEVLVVHCRTGSRSARAVEFLRANGFANAVNLRGGIRAWAAEIDPELRVV